MRIVHFADVHIGVESYGRPASEQDIAALPSSFAPGMTDAEKHRTYTGLSTRLLDFLAALDQVVDQAIARHADVALFCGDAYKSRDPSQTQQREFARRIARLAAAGIPVLLVVGNHDQPHSLGRATALDIFPTLHRATDTVPQILVADRVDLFRIETPSGPLQVVTVPWVRRGAFMARDEHRGKSMEDLTRFVEDELTRRIWESAQTLDPDIPAVLAGHVTVMGGLAGSEQPMTLGRDHVLQRSAVALPAFDYVALGHLHKHQVIGNNPPAVYSGSLQAVDFGEEGDPKGFCLIDIVLSSQDLRGDASVAPVRGELVESMNGHPPTSRTARRMTWQFIPVQSRPFVTIDADVTQTPDPTAKVLQAISQKPIQDAMVRVRIAGPEEAMRHLDDRAIRKALEPAYSVVAITRDVAREKRLRLGTPATGLAPEEALKKYLDTKQQVSLETKARALQLAKHLIAENQARSND
ncbi:MAG: exonuclease SbcCD subunit D [Dehalococcoidia bacterium]|nr:exonuclease SbcCD subunit D [Dehalococcoidia bacterium]